MSQESARDEAVTHPVTPHDIIRLHARLDGHETRLSRVEAQQESTAIALGEFRVETRAGMTELRVRQDDYHSEIRRDLGLIREAVSYRKGWWAAATRKESLVLLLIALVGVTWLYVDRAHNWLSEFLQHVFTTGIGPR